MRMKVSDYIARKLVDEGISDVFMVTGGGAMHLDDGLGHEPGLHCTFNHHEQACAIAAECYARIHNLRWHYPNQVQAAPRRRCLLGQGDTAHSQPALRKLPFCTNLQ